MSTSKFLWLSGKWSLESTKYRRGTVDASLSARCVTGNETDEDYTFKASVKLTSGKASVIVNYVQNVDWSEQYLALTLDPTFLLNGVSYPIVALEAVQRDANGLETSRTVLALAPMALAAGQTHDVEVQTKTLSDNSKAVYGYVDDFLIGSAEGLLAGWSVGLRGFESLGADGEYNDFREIDNKLDTETYYSDMPTVKHLCGLDELSEVYDDKLDISRKSADQFINTALKPFVTTPLSVVPGDIVQAANYLASGLYMQPNVPNGYTHPNYKIGENQLNAYIAAVYQTRGKALAYGRGDAT